MPEKSPWPTHKPEDKPTMAFTVPEGYVLGYHVTREAWYAQHAAIPGDYNVMMIGLYGVTGGCRWEFAVDREPLEFGTLRIGVYDEAWQAFGIIPEVFAALGENLGRGALVEEVTELLDGFGFQDLTPRVNPHAAATPANE